MIATGFLWALTAAMVAVIAIDTARYLIPNRLNAALLLLWLSALLLLPIAPLPAVGAAALLLFVGLGFFALGLMGGGDIKLLVVLTLWTGWSMATVQFLVLTALVGGVLVLVLLPLRVLLEGERPMPRVLTRKQPVPYGIAIAGAFLLMLWRGMVPPLA